MSCNACSLEGLEDDTTLKATKKLNNLLEELGSPFYAVCLPEKIQARRKRKPGGIKTWYNTEVAWKKRQDTCDPDYPAPSTANIKTVNAWLKKNADGASIGGIVNGGFVYVANLRKRIAEKIRKVKDALEEQKYEKTMASKRKKIGAKYIRAAKSAKQKAFSKTATSQEFDELNKWFASKDEKAADSFAKIESKRVQEWLKNKNKQLREEEKKLAELSKNQKSATATAVKAKIKKIKGDIKAKETKAKNEQKALAKKRLSNAINNAKILKPKSISRIGTGKDFLYTSSVEASKFAKSKIADIRAKAKEKLEKIKDKTEETIEKTKTTKTQLKSQQARLELDAILNNVKETLNAIKDVKSEIQTMTNPSDIQQAVSAAVDMATAAIQNAKEEVKEVVATAPINNSDKLERMKYFADLMK